MSGAQFELWDFESANLVGAYDDETSALSDVVDDVQRNGRESALSLVLLRAVDDIRTERVAAGDDLVRRAFATMPNLDYVGIGLYSIREAALLIRSTTAELRRWLNRDEYQSHGKIYHRKPFVNRAILDDPDTVTFRELMQLRVIRDLRRHGIPMRRIRQTAERLADLWQDPFPFATAQFRDYARTDGGYIYFGSSTGAIHLAGESQTAFDKVIGPLLQAIDYTEGGQALRWWPETRAGRVVLDASRQFGTPLDYETGVPTRVLYLATKANPTLLFRDVARWYEVPEDAVVSAVTYETSLLAA